MGLVVAVGKTEAIWMYGLPRGRLSPPPESHLRIQVGEAYVDIKPSMRYLGLTIDGRWRFEDHFDLLAPQVLTGHGCFREYLHGVGQEPTAQCHHCDEDVDPAQHTLEECPALAEQRRVLRAAVGVYDLSLGTVVDHMVYSNRSWKAVASFSGMALRAPVRPG
ncbi:uncharacterized protein LOC128896595 [Hylaeus anthracinus]|uniref:uncharacterized protein LOC128896595 n=1 Tax=Hylaeus anthracinus TaxID=313031 RepID=UPI0023B8DCA6|nr:uncharacterized protein LOC128896595 [Hylaeus anthracinus]